MRGLACKNVEETIPSPLTLYGRWLSYPCSQYSVANYFPLFEVGGRQTSTTLHKLMYEKND